MKRKDSITPNDLAEASGLTWQAVDNALISEPIAILPTEIPRFFGTSADDIETASMRAGMAERAGVLEPGAMITFKDQDPKSIGLVLIGSKEERRILDETNLEAQFPRIGDRPSDEAFTEMPPSILMSLGEVVRRMPNANAGYADNNTDMFLWGCSSLSFIITPELAKHEPFLNFLSGIRDSLKPLSLKRETESVLSDIFLLGSEFRIQWNGKMTNYGIQFPRDGFERHLERPRDLYKSLDLALRNVANKSGFDRVTTSDENRGFPFNEPRVEYKTTYDEPDNIFEQYGQVMLSLKTGQMFGIFIPAKIAESETFRRNIQTEIRKPGSDINRSMQKIQKVINKIEGRAQGPGP